MRVSRFAIAATVITCLGLGVWSCSDKGTEPPEVPVTPSPTDVSIVPGTTRSVTISGGTPPYHVTQQPIPQIGTAAFDDSTVSPAILRITVITSATVSQQTTVEVDDSDTFNGGPVSIGITVVAVGNISYSDDIQPIWDGTCQNRGCHPGGGAPFSLDRFVSYNNLYFFVAQNRTCGVTYRVYPNEPDSSLVYLMVAGKTSCPRMPLSPLPSDTMSLQDQIKIHDWIVQGANNN